VPLLPGRPEVAAAGPPPRPAPVGAPSGTARVGGGDRGARTALGQGGGAEGGRGLGCQARGSHWAELVEEPAPLPTWSASRAFRLSSGLHAGFLPGPEAKPCEDAAFCFAGPALDCERLQLSACSCEGNFAHRVKRCIASSTFRGHTQAFQNKVLFYKWVNAIAFFFFFLVV
jgi:hypothetical protein